MLGRGRPLKNGRQAQKKEAPLVERPPFVYSVYCYDHGCPRIRRTWQHFLLQL